jgi:hypothetical protein
MGTSALEASSAGLPSVIAIDSCSYMTYGFLNQLPFGNVGEMLSCPPKIRISQCIHEFSLLSENQRRQLGVECRSSSLRYTKESFHDSITKHLSNSALRQRNNPAKCLAILYACTVMLTLAVCFLPRKLINTTACILREAFILG